MILIIIVFIVVFCANIVIIFVATTTDFTSLFPLSLQVDPEVYTKFDHYRHPRSLFDHELKIR